MRTFYESLKAGEFVVTSELNPPKGTDLSHLINKAEILRGMVHAFNLTDSAGSNMTMGNIAVANILSAAGFDPILQVACRDRNRLALQGELLAADVLGIHNILCMTGDPPTGGDHPEAKPVFDLDAVQLLSTIRSLNSGHDLSGNLLMGTPKLFPGAVVNPGAANLEQEISRMAQKIDAGAQFFQTQAVFNPDLFEIFMDKARPFGIPILAGIIVLKSGKMAHYLNKHLPGVDVPKAMVEEIDQASSRKDAGIAITARIISKVREMCDGTHIMAIGWEDTIPTILEAVNLGDTITDASHRG